MASKSKPASKRKTAKAHRGPKRAHRRPAAKRKQLTRKGADKFLLYEKSVQSADVDAELIANIFQKEVGRPARSLREDFCGSAWLCAEWVKRHSDNHAVGLDLSPEVLAWGKRKHIDKLGDKAKRVRLLEQNVLHPSGTKHDVIIAYNYSFNIFKERAVLLEYFRAAFKHLVKDGAFFLDVFGGPASMREEKETRKLRGFVYEWEQEKFNPINFDFLAHIHFVFPDGTRLAKAFTYDWRLWQLTEIRDMLHEVGFKTVRAYWENEDKRGQGNGTFRKREVVDADDSWTAYLVALKS
jgi:SAM-dependent methyltransferase